MDRGGGHSINSTYFELCLRYLLANRHGRAEETRCQYQVWLPTLISPLVPLAGIP